jgi:hypothetical protein
LLNGRRIIVVATLKIEWNTAIITGVMLSLNNARSTT